MKRWTLMDQETGEHNSYTNAQFSSAFVLVCLIGILIGKYIL